MSIDATISPHGWPVDIRATIDPDTKEAWHFDGEHLYRFGPDEYEAVAVWSEPNSESDERPPCKCEMSTLMNRGCVCGHLRERYRVPR